MEGSNTVGESRRPDVYNARRLSNAFFVEIDSLYYRPDAFQFDLIGARRNIPFKAAQRKFISGVFFLLQFLFGSRCNSPLLVRVSGGGEGAGRRRRSIVNNRYLTSTRRLWVGFYVYGENICGILCCISTFPSRISQPITIPPCINIFIYPSAGN